jgi:hypothetical protein
MSSTPSTQSLTQVKLSVKLEALPAGVHLSTDGQWLMRTCPACQATGKVGVYPGRLDESLAKITRRAWVCRACEDEMRANFLAYEPEAGNHLAAEYRQEFC